jgi:hypothetical protein
MKPTLYGGLSKSEPAILPTPALQGSFAPRNKWENERAAFRRLVPSLLPEYRGRCVAVHEGRVVDDAAALVTLALRVFTQYGYVPIYMDLVADQQRSAERWPRVRVIGDSP